MSLADEIFPTERAENLVQTQWAAGWTLGSIGFQEAAQFLTEHGHELGATIDQVGLVVFYLQRHRMELGMKEVHLAAKRVPNGHKLAVLWNECRSIIGPTSKSWRELDADCSELVLLIHEHDPDGARFRYASDLAGNPYQHPEFISLEALEKHVTGFLAMLQGYLDHWELYAEERESASEVAPAEDSAS